MILPKNTSELIVVISTDEIISSMIQQLNKDFQLCNLRMAFKLDLLPSELFKKLSQDILFLITNQYDDYLNLLYRIDIPEAELLQLKNNNSDQLTFLILKRVYQKVWLKRNFDKL